MSLTDFGRLADGRPVRAARLSRPGGLDLEIIEYGAIIRTLMVPVGGERINTVLGFDALSAYEADPSYQGCIVGRCANRIGRARFTIDRVSYLVEANEGANTLHGGQLGFGKRLWRFEEPVSATEIALTYVSPNGEAGFPGEARCRVVFSLPADDVLEIQYEATVDHATPLNLCHHPYFNLSGVPGASVLDHELQIRAPAITPVEPDLIPTGAFMPVEGTAFDFRRPRGVGDALAEDHPQLRLGGGIDHNWVLEQGVGPAVRLRSPRNGLTLSLTTDQPGLQVYGGQGLPQPFVSHGAVVLEPQGFPDAVNQPDFPSVIVRPGEVYRRRAIYRFAVEP